MKKLLIALLMAGVLGGAVYGAAASLGVVSGSLGAGSDTTIASCDTTGVTVSYTVAYNGSFLEVDDVVVSGIDVGGIGDCDGADLTVQLTDGGVALGGSVTLLGVNAASESVDVSAENVDASLVDDVHVALVGGS